MTHPTTLILLDGDFRRRAAISHCLAASSLHVEPFEDLAELNRRWPDDGVLLVHDSGDIVARLAEAMAEHGHWMPLVVYAEAPSTSQVVRAVQQGALEYLDAPLSAAQINDAIALALAKSRDGHAANGKLREAMARGRIRKLTRREREVLIGVADGLSNRLIGERLIISPRTVEIHRANMLQKMGAAHTSEAIRIAIEASLVS